MGRMWTSDAHECAQTHGRLLCPQPETCIPNVSVSAPTLSRFPSAASWCIRAPVGSISTADQISAADQTCQTWKIGRLILDPCRLRSGKPQIFHSYVITIAVGQMASGPQFPPFVPASAGQNEIRRLQERIGVQRESVCQFTRRI